MFKRIRNITTEEFKDMIPLIHDKIKELKFQEFMAGTYTEKGIIREDINKLEDKLYQIDWILKERQWELEDKLKLERK